MSGCNKIALFLYICILHCSQKSNTLLRDMRVYHYTYPYEVDNRNAGLEVREGEEIFEHEHEQLLNARLNDIAPIEVWTATGTNAQVSYATHGLFRYFGKFPSTIAAHLIHEYTQEGDVVMDPMAGSGTTALECLLSNRNCHSFDINPLSVLLAKVKTTKVDKDALLAELDVIKEQYRPLSVDEFNRAPVGLRNPDHWFMSSTQSSIRGLLKIIEDIADQDIRDFFTICLCSIIRNVSRATSQQGRLFLDALSAKADCLDVFVKKAEKGIDRVSKLPVSQVDLNIRTHNISETIDDVNCRLIILHPPYFNSYKYSSVNSLELSWLGYDQADVRKGEVREFFKVGKAEKVDAYVQDMKKALLNISETLHVNGVLGMMIGDTVIKGEYIPATRMLIDAFLSENPDIVVEKVVLRVPKYTEASWSASQRRTTDKVGITLSDFIVIFRKLA